MQNNNTAIGTRIDICRVYFRKKSMNDKSKFLFNIYYSEININETIYYIIPRRQ